MTSEAELIDAQIAAGGVFFECQCGATGVIEADNPVAQAARKQTGVLPPSPVIVDFAQCLLCMPAEPEPLGLADSPNTIIKNNVPLRRPDSVD